MALVAGSVKTVIKAVLPVSVRRLIRRQQRRLTDKGLFLRHLRSTDIFLVGHPKSGNTWLAYMLAIVLHEDGGGDVTLANVGQFVPYVHGREALISQYGALPDPRVFRNEAPRFGDAYPRTIYLVRDPRAALVSYFNMHNTIFADRPLSFRAFLGEYMAHGHIRHWERIPRWDRQVAAWLRRAQAGQRVLLVGYEDMVRNREEVLRKVVSFCSLPHSEDGLRRAVARGSFEAMRANEEQFGAESYPGEIGRRGRFIRRGKADGWRDELDGESIDRIVREFAPVMKLAGYS